MKIRLQAWLLIASIGAFCSCTPKTVEETTLPDEKIARIMADISIADAASNGLSGPEKDSLMQIYFRQVFEKHGTSLEIYEKDLRTVAKDLSRMEKIVSRADEMLTESEKKVIQ